MTTFEVVTASLPHCDSRPLGVHTRGNVHRLQFLEEQLRRIGELDLRDPSFVLAWPALERLLGQIPGKVVSQHPRVSLGRSPHLHDGGHQPADVTHMHPVRVRDFE